MPAQTVVDLSNREEIIHMPDARPQSVASAAPPYTVRRGDAARDVELATALWREGGMGSRHGEQMDRARYTWFYLDNPRGTARVNLLTHGAEQAIGFLGIGRRRFFMRGEPVEAGPLVDFVVSPKHRSVFPALLLQREGRAQALQSMDMLYGLPDTKAVAICKRLESQVTFELPRYVRVVRSVAYLQRVAPRWVVAPLAFFADALDGLGLRLQLLLSRQPVGEWVEDFDERFDRLWQRFEQARYCIGERGSEFLRWRFKRQPARDYKIFTLCEHRSRDLLAYFVCEADGGALRVKDMLSCGRPGDLKAGLLLLSREARRMGLQSVEVQIAADETTIRTLKGSQFLWRSSRPFFAMVNAPLRQTSASVPWYITQADEDV
jgi:hypothetical protein